MTISNSNFIQLNRTFVEIQKSSSLNDDGGLRSWSSNPKTTWSDLLNEYRVVILAEAGAGKTSEIENQAKEIRNQGKAAFFLRLELIVQNFELAFEAGSKSDFDSWLNGNEEAWIFLDSVDEARLENPRDFENALKHMGIRIKLGMDRAHVFVTSRPYAWRKETDLVNYIKYLPFEAPSKYTDYPTDNSSTQEKPEEGLEKNKEEAFNEKRHTEKDQASSYKIFTLADLNLEQVKHFLIARQTEDADKFLKAVERHNAQEFTTRPQDLNDIVTYWNEYKKIGSLRELIEFSIQKRLQERDQNRVEMKPLDSDKLRFGAKFLATATTLSKNQTLQVPDGSNNANGLEVEKILTDWGETKILALLSKPIFDEAHYGTVRFHHRSIREYLTAQWFAELLQKETSRRQIEGLFFREQYGQKIITPTLRPILHWLCLFDEKVRAQTLALAPEVALEGGDPSQWPVEDRRRIVREICQQIASSTLIHFSKERAALQRFAKEDLADDLCQLLQHYHSDDEVRAFLLEMIWLGEIKNPYPQVRKIALSTETTEYLRIMAFKAISAIGSQDDKKSVRDTVLNKAPVLNREYIAELIKWEEPNTDSIQWLIKSLEKCPKKPKFVIDSLPWEIQAFVEQTPDELLPPLIEAFNTFLSQPPFVDNHYCKISERYEWLLTPAFKLLEKLTHSRSNTVFFPCSLDILHKITSALKRNSEELLGDKSRLAQQIPNWPELNRNLFWFEANLKRAHLESKGERLIDWWSVSLSGYKLWQFDTKDFDYIANQITIQSLQDNKLIALSIAFDLYVQNNRPKKWREKLKKLTEGNEELSKTLASKLKPPKQSLETRRAKARHRYWNKTVQLNQKKQEQDLKNWKTFLTKNLEKLRAQFFKNPKELGSQLFHLHNYLVHNQQTKTRYGQYNWKVLINIFGSQVAQFYRDAAVAFWRNYTPQLHSEGQPFNKTNFGTIFGLIGLEIEFHESPDILNNITDEEVELACKYAAFELNGFPTWFPKLFAEYPRIVSQFLFKEIQYELSVETAESNISYILDSVRWSGQWAWNILAPEILEWLDDNEPITVKSLELMLKIIQGSTESDSTLAKLAESKCSTLTLELSHLACWFAVWTGVDPDQAIPKLQQFLESLKVEEKTPNEEFSEATKFSMHYLTHLFPVYHHNLGGTRSAFHTVQHIKTIHQLMNQYIRPEEDINRANTGSYSPKLRDFAQDARRNLLEVLLNISDKSKEYFLALIEIAESSPAYYWLMGVAKARAEDDGDLRPMKLSQVQELYKTQSYTPKSNQELADLGRYLLLDLKDDLERGDHSPARTWIRAEDESEMRVLIGRELRNSAQGRYTIVEEEELANAQRPDFRLISTHFNEPVPIELKLADNWTGPQFFERLENQLCRDYLRDHHSNRGIFLLVNRKPQKNWKLPEKMETVDFQGLVEALQAFWDNDLTKKFPNIDSIAVIGIDLTLHSAKTQKNNVPSMSGKS